MSTALALEINDLTKVYRSGTRALDSISFQVEEGDFFALLGPNGAGKSTTIGIITSLVHKTSGEVKVFGKDQHADLREVKKLIGVVPQEYNFNIFEPVENILYTQAGYYGLRRSEVHDRVDYYLSALGLEDKRKKKAQSLSGGMKRRLMIARALVHEPKLLILDEPTAGVDIELRRSMWDFLKGLNEKGKTIILTTHYLEEAENLCRNIAIINHGKIVRNTSMRQLLRELETETLILDLKDSCEILPESGDGFTFRQLEPQVLEVVMEKRKSMNELFALLEQHHMEVSSLRNKANRLEELFIRLTQKETPDASLSS